MKELTVERMYELEKMVKENKLSYPLHLNKLEFRYVERAKKIPYDEAREDMRELGELVLVLAQIRCIYKLLAKYNTTYEELNQRFKDVENIRLYENSLNNKLLKEQKQMIKRMNR